MSEAKRIYIVEDDFLVSEYLKGLCSGFGAEVLGVAADAETAIAEITKLNPDYVLMDVRIHGELDGVDIADFVYRELPDTRVIFITASNEPTTLARISKGRPFQVLIKPFRPDDLRLSIMTQAPQNSAAPRQ